MPDRQQINVAFIHHHLNRGGVTHVILNQLASLEGLAKEGHAFRVAILFGGRKSIDERTLAAFPHLDLKLIELPQLEYDSIRETNDSEVELGQLIVKQLERLSFEQENTILHVHNHSLGKNSSLPLALKSLAQDGYRLLLQLHDFAEDFRASNYRLQLERLSKSEAGMNDVFPDADHVHYCTINLRDKELLSESGLANSPIHYLPNALPNFHQLPDHQSSKQEFSAHHYLDSEIPLMIYPVRGIRRKNLGEAILLAAIAPDPIYVGLTLTPLNESEKFSHDHWQQVVQGLHLPFLFDLGGSDGLPFETNLAAADRILTTSVSEGFGLVFLEAFAYGKELLGRSLPGITDDFQASGIRYDKLYSEIRIPLKLVNQTDFRTQLEKIVAQTWQQYGATYNLENLDQWLRSIQAQGWIDFARLTCDQQRRVVEATVRDPRSRKSIQDLNHDLTEWLSAKASTEQAIIDSNRRLIEEQFSLVSSGKKLLDLYTTLIDSTNTETSVADRPEAILNGFLAIENFYPVRVETNSIEQPDLSDLIRNSLQAIEPIPTNVDAKLAPLADIKAVLFDIYGTLLVSSSGDVGTDPDFEDQQSNEDERLVHILSEHGLDLPTATELLTKAIIEEHRELKSVGVPYPEVEIRNLWQAILSSTKAEEVPFATASEVALRFELLKNPVWKMPNMTTCLHELTRRQIPTGIISNAQFYTMPILESLCGETPNAFGIQPELSHFSYRTGRAKPDQFLYKLAAESLRPLGFQPQQVLYVGNDMTKDMIPAKSVGFVTGLFAGDQRSLRCGNHGDPHNHHAVDLIFTDLIQISDLLQAS